MQELYREKKKYNRRKYVKAKSIGIQWLWVAVIEKIPSVDRLDSVITEM